MAKKKTYSSKLKKEREGAENTLRSSDHSASRENGAQPNAKKAAQRRQVKREATASKARSDKLKHEAPEKSAVGRKFTQNDDKKGTAGKEKAAAAATGKTAKKANTPGKPKKPGNMAVDTISAKTHQSISSNNADENVGVESAHFTEGTVEGGARAAVNHHYSKKLKQYDKTVRAERKADAQAVDEIFKQKMENDPTVSSNEFSRWRQKQAIKKEYAAAKAGKSTASTGASTATKTTQKVAEKAEQAASWVWAFVKQHSGILIFIGVGALLFMLIASMFSSCSVMMSSSGNVVLGTSFTAEDEDILGADEDYTALETALRRQINSIESTHPGYDEYRYNLAEIGHNPYELAALLTVEFEDYTRAEVQSRLQSIFDAQYELTLQEEVETRTRTETHTRTVTDPETGEESEEEYDVEVEYDYYILNVTLTSKSISSVAYTSGLSDDQLERYRVLLETLGNREDLFGDVSFAVPGGQYTDYDIPGEALTDTRFRNMITEAEKYLGYPYVWGGSSPSTSFDCSGFVSWVINNCGNGWSVGRLTASGLMGVCDIIPFSSAQPGDLIFFQGTYNTSGASHVGIYVGNNMMIHCGNPISYTSIATSYWQEHYYCMGRIRN